MENIHQEVLAEVEALHRFISSWIRGEIPNDPIVFDAEFVQRFDAAFLNIQPEGRALSRDDLAKSIREGHGLNAEFRITIENPEVRRVLDGRQLILATYTEVQDGAKNSSPPRNARVSTVLFRRNEPDSRLIWLHLHESKLPLP